ncbi:hypothetical protein [Roseofilum sp. Guam]|uniref:hypothetical protein n=1 Tax=Roseofilum sp. Guam TaxID=2821502 RepID=UPI001B0BBC59|nr:hypothetical protein [Roseofilum sp. Guam]MBP0031346.1 hypothetical protein [Roseofilum sp. Guam]
MNIKRDLLLTTLLSAGVLSFTPIAFAASNELPNGWIVQVEGKGELERQDGRRVRARLGMPVFAGDRLLATDGSLLVQCLNLSLQAIASGEQKPNTCISQAEKTEDEPECSPGSYGCPHRGDRDFQLHADVPYIISPRRTYLRTSTPRFRWHSVPNSQSYTVILKGDGVEIWRTTVEVGSVEAGLEPIPTEIIYSGDRSLEAGISYTLQIETDQGASSLDAQPMAGGIHFQILEPEKQAEFSLKEAQIRQQSLDPAAEHLALARLYLNFDLIAEAIAHLESVVSNDIEGASIYRQLGDLYLLNLGLVPLAQAYYQQGLNQIASDNLEDRAAIAHGLSQIYQVMGDRSQALDWLTEVQQGYQTLGYTQKLEDIRKELRILE